MEKLLNLGVFNLLQAKKAGISQSTLSRWVKMGLIQRVARGLYQHPKSKVHPETLDFIIACAKFGQYSCVGGLTALFHYGLTDQAPGQIWVLVPTSRVNRDPGYRCLRTRTSFKYGIETHDHFRITSIERTLLEGLKYVTKLGERTAIRAVRKAIEEGLTTDVKIGQMATQLKLRKVLEKYWNVVMP